MNHPVSQIHGKGVLEGVKKRNGWMSTEYVFGRGITELKERESERDMWRQAVGRKMENEKEGLKNVCVRSDRKDSLCA